MTESSLVAGKFAEFFSTWSVALPTSAIDERRDGSMYARGWTVRWRWHDSGALEVRASHRMTNERWWVINPDGSEEHRRVPTETVAYMPGDDLAQIKAEHRAARKAHGEAVTAAGMDFEELDPALLQKAPVESTMVWRCDGDPWQVTELAPRPLA
ncbi:hypothetical protein [Luteipulveratus mongoliensis]|uniref:Uncharacterized protein n=1 Tax=Luteipulveratus mongoliensis TaxID=571913 RepID=A0A0K1JGX5_9MICO|nr:hypothetical protein [Luteipulveratus mongoliensis]AKU15956.1 hypothetical protein VV02_08980 [Luteipulveratus mongoliensis]